MAKEKCKEGDIIQINLDGQEGWIGCILEIDRIEEWGVLAYIRLPHRESMYIRVPHEHYDIVGHTRLKAKYDNDKKAYVYYYDN